MLIHAYCGVIEQLVSRDTGQKVTSSDGGRSVTCQGCELSGTHNKIRRKQTETDMVHAGEAFHTDDTGKEGDEEKHNLIETKTTVTSGNGARRNEELTRKMMYNASRQQS